MSGQPDYGDKRLRNKRPGPGGGTRRLHHMPARGRAFVGAKQDRRTCKGIPFSRYGIRRYRANRTGANDNEMALAA